MILAFLAAASASVVTIDSSVGKDLHCLVAMSLANDLLKNESEKHLMETAAFYFMGKIDGEAPGIDFENAMISIITSSGFKDEIKTDFSRCGAELKTLGGRMKVVGRALQERAHQ